MLKCADKYILNHFPAFFHIQGNAVGNFQEPVLVAGYQDLVGPILTFFKPLNKRLLLDKFCL